MAALRLTWDLSYSTVSALGKKTQHTHFFQLPHLTGEPAYVQGGYLQPQHFPDSDIKKKTPGGVVNREGLQTSFIPRFKQAVIL